MLDQISTHALQDYNPHILRQLSDAGWPFPMARPLGLSPSAISSPDLMHQIKRYESVVYLSPCMEVQAEPNMVSMCSFVLSYVSCERPIAIAFDSWLTYKVRVQLAGFMQNGTPSLLAQLKCLQASSVVAADACLPAATSQQVRLKGFLSLPLLLAACAWLLVLMFADSVFRSCIGLCVHTDRHKCPGA